MLFKATNQITVGSRDLRAEIDSLAILSTYCVLLRSLSSKIVNECVALATVLRTTTRYEGLEINHLAHFVVATFTAV